MLSIKSLILIWMMFIQLNNDTGFCNASYDESQKDNIYLSYESAKEVYERVNPGTKVLIHK